MIPELVEIAKTYAVGDTVLEGLVGDFSPADWQVTDPVGHSAIWLVGHLATYRRKVVAMIGLEPESDPWEAAFVRGTSPADIPAGLDPVCLVQAFHAAQKALAAGWDGVTREQLAQPFGRTLPTGSDSIGGAVGFMVWHEAYHLGQLGFLRRLAGLPGRA